MFGCIFFHVLEKNLFLEWPFLFYNIMMLTRIIPLFLGFHFYFYTSHLWPLIFSLLSSEKKKKYFLMGGFSSKIFFSILILFFMHFLIFKNQKTSVIPKILPSITNLHIYYWDSIINIITSESCSFVNLPTSLD